MRIQVVYSPAARRTESVDLDLPEGTTLEGAVQACGLFPNGLAGQTASLQPDKAQAADPDRGGLGVAVWGRRRPLDHRLRDGDRVEVCRPLLIDPKEARRLRGRLQPGQKTGPSS
jgi:putative ubiquitin-RnfH superfamily antitoxin RatB of RatAB toxin-antitoxin module